MYVYISFWILTTIDSIDGQLKAIFVQTSFIIKGKEKMKKKNLE